MTPATMGGGLFLKFILFPVATGIATATTTVAVVHASLSPFAQALIIAIVAATIGAVGSIAGALIARNESDKAISIARENTRHLEDLKGQIGADRRQGDTIEGQ